MTLFEIIEELKISGKKVFIWDGDRQSFWFSIKHNIDTPCLCVKDLLHDRWQKTKYEEMEDR